MDPVALVTPIAGNLHAWKVAYDNVQEGEVVAAIEAMKMENASKRARL